MQEQLLLVCWEPCWKILMYASIFNFFFNDFYFNSFKLKWMDVIGWPYCLSQMDHSIFLLPISPGSYNLKLFSGERGDISHAGSGEPLCTAVFKLTVPKESQAKPTFSLRKSSSAVLCSFLKSENVTRLIKQLLLQPLRESLWVSVASCISCKGSFLVSL